MSMLLTGMLAGLTVMNGWASIRVLTAQELPGVQVAGQLVLIWCVPIVGAMLVLAFHKRNRADDDFSGTVPIAESIGADGAPLFKHHDDHACGAESTTADASDH